jgi:hypothetical protein
MQSSGMLRCAPLVRTDVSEESIASIIKVTRICELDAALTAQHTSVVDTVNIDHSSPILVTLMMEAIRSSETSVLTTATRSNIPEDGAVHSHRRY